MAQTWLESFDLRGKLILAEKGYDSEKSVSVRWAEERGGIMIILSRVNAKYPRHTDWHTYKKRHLMENLFLKLKNICRFATEYEKKLSFSCCCLPYLHLRLVTLTVLKQILEQYRRI